VSLQRLVQLCAIKINKAKSLHLMDFLGRITQQTSHVQLFDKITNSKFLASFFDFKKSSIIFRDIAKRGEWSKEDVYQLYTLQQQ